MTWNSREVACARRVRKAEGAGLSEFLHVHVTIRVGGTTHTCIIETVQRRETDHSTWEPAATRTRFPAKRKNYRSQFV